jgi:hypothetical protein
MALKQRNKNIGQKAKPKKNSTGPVSESGKAISAKNAIVHGATSPRLLNDAEQNKFDSLLVELRKSYPTTNPLIGLQLERIARLYIQLERIQTAIDAQFEKGRLLSNIYESAAKSLHMDDETISAAMNYIMGFGNLGDLVSKNLISVDLELNELTESKRPKSHEDFLLKTPKFCRFLHEEAIENHLDIKDFIAQKVPQISKNLPDHYPERPNPVRFTLIYANYRNGSRLPDVFEAQFKNTEIEEIKRAAEWYTMGIARFLMLTQKIRDFQKLISIEEQATTPDLDHLDRLMRYQTTIQRQLSTAIGELLALTKP